MFGVPIDEEDSARKLDLFQQQCQQAYGLLAGLGDDDRRWFAEVMAGRLNKAVIVATIVTK